MNYSKKHLFLLLFVLSACATKKKLETKAPFNIGEVYAQPWILEDHPHEMGYDVIIPILNLDAEKATLQNLYHKGQRVALEIELRKSGHVAIARFNKSNFQGGGMLMHTDSTDGMGDQPPSLISEPFPLELTDTQAVISYLEKDRVRYLMIDAIRLNPVVSYQAPVVKNQ